MSNSSEIIHLRTQQIDYDKWDQCIHHAENGNLYAKSWYLDIVNSNWEALVLGDYKYVMPLPIIKKFGIRMVMQPLHCQQLGIFPAPNPDIQQFFGKKLQSTFRFVRYQLNSKMHIDSFENFKKKGKKNYLLPLNQPLDLVSDGFTKHAKRNLRDAAKQEVTVVKGLQPAEFFTVKSQADKHKVSRKSYQILQTLVAFTVTKGTGTIYAAYSKMNNLCAAAFIVFDQNRAYYLNAYSTDEGRKCKAMYSIIYEIINEFAGSDMVIDFEGSIIEGVARFYRGFGATSENYYYLYSDRFPFLG